MWIIVEFLSCCSQFLTGTVAGVLFRCCYCWSQCFFTSSQEDGRRGQLGEICCRRRLSRPRGTKKLRGRSVGVSSRYWNGPTRDAGINNDANKRRRPTDWSPPAGLMGRTLDRKSVWQRTTATLVLVVVPVSWPPPSANHTVEPNQIPDTIVRKRIEQKVSLKKIILHVCTAVEIFTSG